MGHSKQISLFPEETAKDSEIANLQQRYLHLTKSVLPAAARQRERHWPVREDHCFQRIVLDHVCQGVWYERFKKPAYKHMTAEQLRAAIAICEEIEGDKRDLTALNRQSLSWRGKL